VSRTAPSRLRISLMVLFAGSCVGLLLFLWVSFGGSVPFVPQGYRFSVEFGQAIELGTQANVEIAGVSVGKVVQVGLDRRTGLTRAVIEIDPQFAPRPADTRAILRQKTLLGETYVELSYGNPRGPMLPDGGRLPRAQVSPTVQLDEILSTFDPATRRAFETWMQGDAIAFTNRGEDFNAALAQLYPFATNVDSVLAVLSRDSGATRALLSDGSRVLSAVSANPAQLQGLIRNADTVFATTAARNAELAATVRAFPSFLQSTRQTIARIDTFAAEATPLVNDLKPAAAGLTPALRQTAALSPQLQVLLDTLPQLTSASNVGVPAVDSFLSETTTLFARLTPYLGGLVPVIDYINDYRREIAAFFANSTATTQAVGQSFTSATVNKHYLRVSTPVNPETLTAYPRRPSSNRSNPYMAPGGYLQLLEGLKVFGSYLCTSNPLPTIGPTVPATLQQVLRSVYFTDDPSGPPCRAQAPLGMGTTGLTQTFPHLNPLR